MKHFLLSFNRLMASILSAVCLISCMAVPINANSYVMTYSFGGTPYIYQNNVEEAQGVLNTLSPSSFDANIDGTVSINGLTAEFVSYLHSQGIAIMPFLSNHWDRAAGNAVLNNIGEVTDTLVKAIKDYELDGINVDIENVNETYRDKYTTFVRTLREKLPDSIVTVAVAANPNNWTAGWHGSYDYAALAKYSDYLMIMAYDESYYGGPPGPVSSANFVERSIEYALSRVPADKLVLGVPLFGRYWKEGVSVGGNGITMSDTETIISLYPDAQVTYDETVQSVKMVVTLTSDFKMWGGGTLTPGTYTIWYEDLQSLEYKMSLINAYELKGLGSWALGQEGRGFWALCGRILKNSIFSDISNHWAEEHIADVYRQGWMMGYDGLFRPDEPMTRAEAATTLVRLAGLTESSADADFDDTKDHWAKEYIAIARKNGLVSGVGGNRFNPDVNITREQMAVILDNAAIFSNAIDFYENPFSDLDRDTNPWSYDSIIKMYANGVVEGYPDGTFQPLRAVERGEMAAMLMRISGFGISINDTPEARNFNKFSADGHNEIAQPPR